LVIAGNGKDIVFYMDLYENEHVCKIKQTSRGYSAIIDAIG
jgi:hypothetical protein